MTSSVSISGSLANRSERPDVLATAVATALRICHLRLCGTISQHFSDLAQVRVDRARGRRAATRENANRAEPRRRARRSIVEHALSRVPVAVAAAGGALLRVVSALATADTRGVARELPYVRPVPCPVKFTRPDELALLAVKLDVATAFHGFHLPRSSRVACFPTLCFGRVHLSLTQVLFEAVVQGWEPVHVQQLSARAREVQPWIGGAPTCERHSSGSLSHAEPARLPTFSTALLHQRRRILDDKLWDAHDSCRRYAVVGQLRARTWRLGARRRGARRCF